MRHSPPPLSQCPYSPIFCLLYFLLFKLFQTIPHPLSVPAEAVEDVLSQHHIMFGFDSRFNSSGISLFVISLNLGISGSTLSSDLLVPPLTIASALDPSFVPDGVCLGDEHHHKVRVFKRHAKGGGRHQEKHVRYIESDCIISIKVSDLVQYLDKLTLYLEKIKW